LSPADALDRVVYLLDRALAEGRRVQAYAKARDLARELGDDAIAQHHVDGTLLDLPGIGPSTSKVIVMALDGGIDEYLSKLEVETAIDEGEGGELRAALKGDCHTHSTWSDGGAPIKRMAQAAIGLGHDYLVMTDHSPRLTVAHGLNRERLLAQLDEIDALNERLAPFRLLTGAEVDIFPDGTLDGDDDMLERLDVVVASVHSKLSMDRMSMTKRMVTAVLDPRVSILGHCTGRKLKGLPEPGPEDESTAAYIRAQSTFDADIVFAACEAAGTAVEINCRPERRDPPDELLALAVDVGCLVSIDTDAHAPAQLEWQPYGCDKAARHGLTPDRIVNSWSADDLVAWAGADA
jgi:putative hydrolase